jgi:predicted nucleotidyltransferase
MIDVSPVHLETVKKILARNAPGLEIRAFGSRVNGSAKEHSDLDLAVIGTPSKDRKILRDLRAAFEDSDLPFRVDIVDWDRISDRFRAVIEEGYEVILP